ncbi:6-pyruvoyl tetrahydrobiopterin synthase-like [Aquarana catesbeiana]|uniref:6-pyruvoyl tetrahydrobiopterin synthase-like n=1 Tax=Aquarana catesbeiana TaxID=8400 RepID=UPI003CC9AE5A
MLCCSNSLSDEENKRIFGKCNNPNGHGHNYKGPGLHLTASRCSFSNWAPSLLIGHSDPSCLLDPLSSSKANLLPVENVTVFIWDGLQKRLPPGLLHEVCVHETDNNTATYRGE